MTDKAPTLRSRLANLRKEIGGASIAAGIGAGIAVSFRPLLQEFLKEMKPGDRALAIQSLVTFADSALKKLSNPSKRSTLCADCGAHGYGYMLKDEVWNTATAARPAHVLCMPCVVRRIGRPLVVDDLGVGLPINDPIYAALAIAGAITWDQARAESSANKHWQDLESATS